jgi:hypothetical protein
MFFVKCVVSCLSMLMSSQGLYVYALCWNFRIGYINNYIKYSDTWLCIFESKFSLIIHIFSFLDFKLSLCCILSFGRFPSVFIGRVDITYEYRTECSSTSAHKSQMPGNRPKARIRIFICSIKTTLITAVLNFHEYRFVTPTQFLLHVPVKHKLVSCCFSST